VKAAVRTWRSWLPGRWTWGVIGVLAAQIAVVLVFSSRAPLQRRESRREFQLTLAPGADSVLAHLQALSDPTLFALPSSRSFAGGGWKRETEYGYQSREWTEPLHWLTNSAVFPAPNPVTPAVASSRPAGLDKPGARVSEAAPAPLPLPGRSVLRLEGAIAGRAFRSVPELPAIVHSNLLADTTIRIGVQADGLVFSAAVARSSGLRSADEQALAIARGAQFEPDPAPGSASGSSKLSWGELIFRWRVVPDKEGPRP
jgi:TonB family protein